MDAEARSPQAPVSMSAKLKVWTGAGSGTRSALKQTPRLKPSSASAVSWRRCGELSPLAKQRPAAIAPDCEVRARSPGCGVEAAKLALSFTCGSSTPRQLGPTRRMLAAHAAVSHCLANEPGPWPRGNDDGRWRASGAGFNHDRRDCRRRCGDHRQVRRARKIAVGFDRVDSLDRIVMRVDE